MKKLLALLFVMFSFSQLMSNDVTWSFPPTTLSTATVNASDPQIAIDANGNLVAAWVENSLVKSSSKQVNMSWSAPVTLSNSNASSPRIVSDPRGNAAAVWLESGVVKGATKLFSGSWTSATTLSSSGASSPDLAVDSAGDVIAVWARGNNVESSTKIFGNAWGTHATITSAAAANPHVAMGSTGASTRAVVVWNGTSGSTNVIYSATKLVSASWSAQAIISDTSHNAGNAHVAVDANANVVAVWYKYDVAGSIYSNVVVQSAYRNAASGSWSPPASLSNPGIYNPASLVARVGFDANENAIALWNTSFDGATFDLQSAVLPVRGTWVGPIEVVNNVYALEADMAVSSLGDALATFMFYNGSSLITRSAEANFSGFMQTVWSVPINLSTGTENGFPRIAATLTGNVINAAAVWIGFNGTHNTIQAVTGTRALVLPPSCLSVTQNVNNFSVFNEYYNTLSWHASSDPNVESYVIFRNGAFLMQVDASVLQIIDHNKVQNGSVTYGVAAIDAQQSQSAIVNVSFP